MKPSDIAPWYTVRYGTTKVLLDPCPFCGGKAEYTAISSGETDDIACGCLKCSAKGPYKSTIDKAARAWNRRKPLPKISSNTPEGPKRG